MTRVLLAACLALAGCAGAPGAPGGAKEHAYLCGGGRMAYVSYSGDSATVRLANDSFALQRERSASGARYGNARAALHTRDDEALLTVDGRQLGPCQEVKTKP